MKITCDHCGSLVDTDKDKCCPSCGAPLGETKDYKEYKDYRKKNRDYDLRERDADIHTKEIANQMLETGMKTHKGISIFVIGFIILVFGIMIFMIGKGIFSQSGYYSKSQYEISCDSLKVADENVFSKFENKSEDVVYYSFHIVFKNTDGKWRSLTNINVTYTDENGNTDVVAKKPAFSNMNDSLESFAKDKVTYTGYLTFEIPNYVKDVKIVFEDATYNLKNFRSLIVE